MVVVHNLDRSDAYMHGFEREKEGFARGAHEGLDFFGRGGQRSSEDGLGTHRSPMSVKQRTQGKKRS